ncbi:hypothetical protein I2I11_11800 [Pontibacter sp. 172403-2]|uniref:hypothetical protein n=1 Tax=Pontibacter rufus TaxID=2791028 RepID=UPI0018AFDA45|nr:hypothetical protein [Pontibacter sp. 172403-2]MBF9253977.1 hypothetical protein [Pontibacter sp. 172403-2]
MKKLTTWLLTLLLTGLTCGVQAQSQSQVETDLNNLRAWMREKSSMADSTIRAEWPLVKKEYKAKTSTLDQNAKELSDSSRAEYNSIKQRYQQWEAQNETRKATNPNGRELENWERRMTGTSQIGRIRPANLRDSFVQALELTRTQRRDWSLRDWDYAELVMGEMNTRKNEVLDKLSNSDKIKIAALQVEFATLKKSREAKDAYENVREEH